MSADIIWPAATLSPIARARAIAAAIPSAGIMESTLDAPFAEAWAFLADLPRSVPQFDRDVSSITVRGRVELGDGAEQLRVTVHNHGVPWPFTVRLESGFCLMRARGRLYTVVMAATPDPADPTRTRFVHVEAVPLPGAGFLRPVLAGLARHDVHHLARLARDGFRT